MLQGQQSPEPGGERRPVREAGECQRRGERQGQHQQPDGGEQAWPLPQSHRQPGGERRYQRCAQEARPLHRSGGIVYRQIDQPRQPDKGGVAREVGGELQHAKAHNPVGEVQGIVGIEGHREGK
ncbi:hypothetical protein D3C87_1827840 [compost metagenome]